MKTGTTDSKFLRRSSVSEGRFRLCGRRQSYVRPSASVFPLSVRDIELVQLIVLRDGHNLIAHLVNLIQPAPHWPHQDCSTTIRLQQRQGGFFLEKTVCVCVCVRVRDKTFLLVFFFSLTASLNASVPHTHTHTHT